MQRTYQFFIFIAIFALSFQPLKGAGLLFSRETPQTYLDLFSGNDISFTNSVTISFDLSIHSHESFGQIWVYEDKAAPYSFAYIGRDKSSSSFVINSLTDKKQFLEIPVSPQAIGARKWLHVETRLDFQHQKAEVTIDRGRNIRSMVLLFRIRLKRILSSVPISRRFRKCLSW